MQYKLNNGSYQFGNTFTVGAGTYVVTVKDAEGFTATTNQLVIGQPTALTATIASNNPTLYFGYSGDQTATITATPVGGTAPYRVSITMVDPLPVPVGQPARPVERVGGKLICDYINSAGDEVWTSLGATYSTVNTCGVQPVSTSSNPANTTFNNILPLVVIQLM